MTHVSHAVTWPQTAQRTGEAASTGERQPSRDRHRHVHHPQTARASIALTCGDARPRSVFSENAGVAHFIPDGDDPAGLVAALASTLAPGSFVALSHLTADFAPEQVASGVAAYNALVPAGITARSHAEVTSLFGGTSLVAPGVVPVTEWRPDHAPVHGVSADMYAGLATTGRPR
jgi:hypothetical protein